MHKISDKLLNFITKATENWKVEFASGQNLAERKIQRVIFERDLFSPLPFLLQHGNDVTELNT